MTKRKFLKEADVKAEIKSLLKRHGWFWWMPPANGFGKAGATDFHALRGGVFLAIEAKFGTNKPTPLQVGFMHSIHAEGGLAMVVNERRLDAFTTWLEAFDRSAKAVQEKKTVAPEDGAAMLDALREMTVDLV